MKCPQCRLIEMRVKEVKDDMVTFICPKCGKEIKEKVNNEPK